jgi:hypothetical protein
MATIAGLDLGYGSQVQLVKTNYLFVGTTAARCTAQAQANLLHLYNRNVNASIKADYINVMNGAAASTAASALVPLSGTDPTVIDSADLTNWPMRGPSASHLAQASGLHSTGDTAAEMGITANGQVLNILSVGAVTFSGADWTTPVVQDTLGIANGVDNMNNLLLIAQASGPSPHIDFTDVFADIIAALTAAATLVGTVALLNDSFVLKGNAAGTTETLLSTVSTGTIVADTSALVSVLAIVKNN